MNDADQPADTPVLLAASMRAIERVWRDGYRYKKAGIELREIQQRRLSSAISGPILRALNSRR